MAAESKLQSRIHRYLKKKGWFVNKIILCSVNGWPDTFAMKTKPHRTLYIELKSPGKKAKPLQEYVHDQIRAHGGEVHVIDCWEDFLKLNL